MKTVTSADRIRAGSRRHQWLIARDLTAREVRKASADLTRWAERYPHADHTCTLRMLASELRRRDPRSRAGRSRI
jgi:hypothetical protein